MIMKFKYVKNVMELNMLKFQAVPVKIVLLMKYVQPAMEKVKLK